MSKNLLLIAALPVLLIGMFIYSKDRNKEPRSLLFRLLMGGVGSVFLVFIANDILEMVIPGFDEMLESKNMLTIFVGAVFGVGLIEESAKWIFAYKLSYNNKEFDELYDMIIYCVFVSLGFALFENILYVAQGGMIVGITRAFLAVPGHACDGVFMGHFLGLAKYHELLGQEHLKKKYMALSIIVPTIMHGIYDFLLLSGNTSFILLFFVLVVIMYIFSIQKINAVAALNTNFYNKIKYCPNCGTAVNGKFCGNCGKQIEQNKA